MSEQQDDRQAAEGSDIAQASGGSTASVTTNYNYGNVPFRPVDADTLVEAQRRLSEMPLDEVPHLVPPPQGSRILFGHNPFFVGREEKCKELARILKAGEADAEGQVVTVAITGIGGVGKSQLASEFVHHYGQYFLGGVFWLSFAEAIDVPTEVAKSGGAGSPGLGTDFGSLSPEDRVLRMMSAWQSELPRLLVFDNCEEEGLVDQWRPPVGGCRMILTSRREIWNPRLGVRVVPLDVLKREDSVALLRKHRPDLAGDDPVLEAIAKELGDLPLALELAGGFLARYRRVVSSSDYLAQLQSPKLLQHPSLQGTKDGISPIQREQNVAKTFALSYEQLDTEDPIDALATALLARAALFAPGEPIPRELLVKALNLPKGDPEAPLRAEDALLKLGELGLLQEQEADAQRMHRLVAAFVRGAIDDVEAQQAVEEALVETFAGLSDKEYLPKPLLALLPHLRVATDVAKQREDERAASLCHYLGDCLTITAAYPEARSYLERGLAIRRKVLGEEHPDTAESLATLAGVLSDQGKYAEARPLYERALAIYEEKMGKEHPDTANCLNSFGASLYNQGAKDEARPLYERALAIYEKVYGEEHLDTAIALNNLANVLPDDEARPLHERALAIRRKVLGEEHPDTANSLTNLANLLPVDEARPLHERALAIYEEKMGKEHPDTATVLNFLANVVPHDEARPLYERALAIYEKVYGEEHLDTAKVLRNLGALLDVQGNYDEARQYVERALAIRRKVLGEEHPDTAESLATLAGVLSDQGKYAEARPLYERALAIYEEKMGKEHPDTAATLSNLAWVLYGQGDYQEARRLHERALAIYKEVLGEDHPYTEQAREDLNIHDALQG